MRLTPRRWVSEFRHRWPAIRSILRDGTVVYKATIDRGTVVLNRPNSCFMDTSIYNAEPFVPADFKP